MDGTRFQLVPYGKWAERPESRFIPTLFVPTKTLSHKRVFLQTRWATV